MTVVANDKLESAKKFADAAERVLWTAAEGAGAVGLIAGYQALSLPNIPDDYVVLATILLGAVLAGIKASVAQQWGNGTAATLPSALETTPNPTQVVVETPDVVDEPAVVAVEPVAVEEEIVDVPEDAPLDDGANYAPEDLDNDGVDDNTGELLARRALTE